MTSFVENLINNELPISGFKPSFTPRELLREQRDPKALSTVQKPVYRGFFEKNWKHGSSLQSAGNAFNIELGDVINLGKFNIKNQFVATSGQNMSYRATLGVDLKEFGDLEVTQQAKNNRVCDSYQIAHYNSRNGLTSSAKLLFSGPHYDPLFSFSSVYNQTMEVFDRKTMKLTKRNTIYGIDTSLSFAPLQQLQYSLYYQTKGSNYDMIAAYLRKSVNDKFFTNTIIGGLKYRTTDNKKLLAKFTYNIEDKIPQLDLMVRNKHQSTTGLKTFHKISSNFRAGSGFTYAFDRFKLHGLAEVNLMNNDYNCQPFSLGFRIELNGDKRATGLVKKTK